MALSVTEIKRIEATIARADPQHRKMLSGLLAGARASEAPRPAQVAFVEVTHSDGLTTVMSAEDYQRVTATDLAHTKLRMLSADEAQQLGLGKEPT